MFLFILFLNVFIEICIFKNNLIFKLKIFLERMIVGYKTSRIDLPEQFRKNPEYENDFFGGSQKWDDEGKFSFMWGSIGITLWGIGDNLSGDRNLKKIIAMAKHDLADSWPLIQRADDLARDGEIESAMGYDRIVISNQAGTQTRDRIFQVYDAAGLSMRELFRRAHSLENFPEEMLKGRYAHLPEMARYLNMQKPLIPTMSGRTLRQALERAVSVWAVGKVLREVKL